MRRVRASQTLYSEMHGNRAHDDGYKDLVFPTNFVAV